jgi:hypothetical protein
MSTGLYPASPALAFLAAPAPGHAIGDVAAAMAEAANHGGPGFRIGIRIEIDLPKRTPDGSAALPLLPSPHAAIALAHGPRESVEPALRALIREVCDCIDVQASVLMAGTEHVVKPGDGAILVMMLAARRAGLTRAGFLGRWLVGHAPFGLRTNASGYRQLHAGDTDSAGPGLPAANVHDGIGMVFFRDLDHVARARSAPEIAREATSDEMAFIDHGRSMLMMFRLRD